MSGEYASSKSGNIKVKIPKGWFAAEDNEYNSTDLWLIKNDYSATLNLIPLIIDERSFDPQIENKLLSATQFSIAFNRAKNEKNFNLSGEIEQIKINGKDFVSYKYLNNSGKLIRVVVFKYHDKYYEFTAIPAKSQSDSSLEDLYYTQDLILSTME
jgi:hypothetical protein